MTLTFTKSIFHENTWSVELDGQRIGRIDRERNGYYGKWTSTFYPTTSDSYWQRLSHSKLPQLRALLQTKAEALVQKTEG